MSVASLVLGILALLIMWIPVIGMGAILVAIIGLALGVSGKKSLRAEGKPTGKATAGIVMSIIALAISLLFTLVCAVCLGGMSLL